MDLTEARARGFTAGSRHPWERARLALATRLIASYVPPSDIVAEFKVQTATFDAQFGNTEGSVTFFR